MDLDLVFATHNNHKLEEVAAMIGPGLHLKSLPDIGCTEDIEETGATFVENAGIKSKYVYANYGVNCFADDSGLVVEALNGEPGVYSARYSGQRDPKVNLELVLSKMTNQQQRSASFVSVISLIWDGEEHVFEGRVSGKITLTPFGGGGFGYDPIFIPDGYEITFAEMDQDEKNRISHRAKAMDQLITFLKSKI
jgi:XTP/dITP diphosphohydrolase